MSAYTIIDIFAVMVKLLHTTVASLAVIAIAMYIHLASTTPNQHVFIANILLKGLIQQPRIYWINIDEFCIVIGDED